MSEKDEKKIVYKISIISIVTNLILVIIKYTAGIIGHSQALVSDAIHSASDVFSTIVVIIGFYLSRKQEDNEHPYGHERIECVAAIILASMLAVTGFALGLSGTKAIINNDYRPSSMPGLITIIAAALSILTKEAMFWYTRHGAKLVKSDALMADAWHHRSDAFSSIGSLVGVLLARQGLYVADSVASILICLMILKAAFDIYRDALKKMVDHSCDVCTINKYRDAVLAEKDVLGIHSIKTRMFGSKVYIDIELLLDGSISLMEAHEIAERIHDKIEKEFPDVKHCMIHPEPICNKCENDREH